METRARDEFLRAVAMLDLDNPDAWGLLAELLSGLMVTYGSASHELGERFYEAFRGENGRGSYDHTAAIALTERLCAEARNNIASGKKTGRQVAESLAGSLGNHVQGENRETLLSCVKRERSASSRRVGYARVPRPDCTCAFCIVMAGRGFVYHNKETAGENESDKFHDHCRCTVVALDDSDTVIGGYDERVYEELYEKARDAIVAGDVPDEVAARISRARSAAEKEGRDFRPLNEIEIMMRYQNEGMH